MTGYGKAVGEVQGKKITVELRSLNSRQFDLNIRTPLKYRDKESELRNELSKQAERGKIDFTVFSENKDGTSTVTINRSLAKSYFNEFKKLSLELNEPADNLIPLVMKMPDILKSEKQEPEEGEWNEVRHLIDKAIKDFKKFRADEGKILKNEFTSRIKNIASFLKEVVKADKERLVYMKEKLKKSLTELKEKIDQNRFEQELIYYLEKLDISEEKLRLQTHLDYFMATMNEPASGRKLGFISQEIGREINTIGSKANDAEMQKLVVQMKDELEKIKEQLLNVL